MKTLLINVNNSSTERLMMDLAKQLHLEARVLSVKKDEDAMLLKMMEGRKNEKTLPVSDAYKMLRKVK